MAIPFMRIQQPVWSDQTIKTEPLDQAITFHHNARHRNAVLAARNRQLDQGQQQIDLAAKRLSLAQRKQAAGPQRPWWAGRDGTVDPAMLKYRQAGRPQTNVNVNNAGQERAFDKAAGKGLYQEFAGYQKRAQGARTALHQLKVMDKALSDPNLYTGTGGQSIQFLKQAARTLFGADVGGVASGEVVANLSKRIALSFKDQLPGPLSNADREFLVSIAPGLSTSRGGNMAIIRLGMAQRQYEIDVAQAAMRYMQQNNGRLNPGWFAVKGQIDQKYGAQFSEIMGGLRKLAEGIPQPPPTAGVPKRFRFNPQTQELEPVK